MSGSPPKIDARLKLDILTQLDEIGGFTTGQVAKAIGGDSVPSSVRAMLVVLSSKGLVRPLDDLKPICWTRTAEGSAFLAAAVAGVAP